MTGAQRGYQELREGAAWLDLSGRGAIRVTGEDRVRLLHAMTTNHIEQLQPGQGCYAFLLNAQGRILADVNLLCFPDHLLLDTEPETRWRVYEHLDKHIIADDVTLEDVTERTAVLGVEGRKSAETLAALGALLPEAVCSHTPWGSRIIARLSWTGAPGFRIFAPLQEKQPVVEQLESADVVAADREAARAVRLELGKPRYAEDVSDKYLPQETQLLHAVHFNKGCYLGQEIVERIRSQGRVHRLLMRLQMDAAQPPTPGTKITAGDQEVGEITSSAFSPAISKVVGLGYLRRDAIRPHTRLWASGAAVEITGPMPAE